MRVGSWTVLLLWSALASCTPGQVPRFRGGTPELLDADPAVPLARVLRVELDRPSRLEVAVRDTRGERLLHFDTLEKIHDVPLLGFRPRDHVTVVVTANDDEGAAEAAPVTFRAGRLPDRFPEIDVLVDRPELAEPGLRLFSLKLVSDVEELSYLAALDDTHEVVWVWQTPFQFGDVRMHDSGVLFTVGDGMAWELTPLGEVLTQWGRSLTSPAQPEHFVDLDVRQLHHELVPLPHANRFLTLSKATASVDDYPCSYTAPEASCGPDVLEDARVVQFTREGEVIRDWSLAERLDTFHIGYDGLDELQTGRDWAHANAVIPDPSGGYVVSVRHQDALVALDRDGEVRWILGDPGGWAPPFRPLLLDPVGDLSWSYHPHGPTFDADGTLWVFDNGNDGGTPYTGASRPPLRSRVVGYRIDEAAGTVTQVAEFRQTATGELYSKALGNAAVMPITGNVLGVYGMPTDQDGTPHVDLGFGSTAVRHVEWTREGELASDVRLRSDLEVEGEGWRSYRAVHTPSLYAAGVEEWR